MVHCDLKPENVFIEHDTGRVVLMDFGLARAEARGLSTGSVRDISGTPAYMAPEQITGDAVDARADLYALGCVLYELVADEVPYPRAITFDAAEEYLKAPVPDPRVHRPDMPLWLARIVSRLLAKDPKQRFRSASAVRNTLQGPRRLTWRHMAMPLLAMTMMVCAVGWYRAIRRTGWHAEVRPRLPAYQEIANESVISPDGQRLAYIANRGGDWRLYVEPLTGGPPEVSIKSQYLYPIRWAQNGKAILGVSPAAQAIRLAIPGGETQEVARNVVAVDDCAGRLVMASSGIGSCLDCFHLRVREEVGGARQERELARLPPGLRVQDLRCDRKGGQVAYATILSKQSNSTQSDIYTMRLDHGAPQRLTHDGSTTDFRFSLPTARASFIRLHAAGHTNCGRSLSREGNPSR